ncbi:hypothetical protein IP91_01108 [Pseudoduganella lurida]|uniref:DUF2059 domain-containing protein n=2 Tax=Pseudoduganella lurida TaxID=1036180 RepID=A0A562RNN4_9BURK|nr:hypothetical protein IP91_01108 [Pseudoduganella lurida]
MKFAVQAVAVQAILSTALFMEAPALAVAPAAPAAATSPAHVKSVEALLGAMHIEKALRGVAARSKYQSDAQRQTVFAKIDKVPPAEIYRRLAPPLTRTISEETATEMTRFYTTPYGQQVINKKYNSGPQIMMSGVTPAVPPEEKKERKRPAYVKASKELADAGAAIDHEAFVLLQQINKEKR